MADLPYLPDILGKGWGVKKIPVFNTQVVDHPSGGETRSALATQARYEFEISYDSLDSNGRYSSSTVYGLQTLMGFFVNRRGRLLPFLYRDMSDCLSSDTLIGVGDGTTTSFVVPRKLGTSTEPASFVTRISPLTVDGEVRADFVIDEPNVLRFTGDPPPDGAEIIGDVDFVFRCRFMDDSTEFENLSHGLWQHRGLKFRSIK